MESCDIAVIGAGPCGLPVCKVEDGTLTWTQVLKDFYGPFLKALETARTEMRNVKRETIPTDIICTDCGAPMVIRWGKNGSFLACSTYPDCRNTSEFVREDGKIIVVKPTIITSGTCDDCGAPMIIKTGKYGRFRACSRYPECKKTAPVSTGVTCPKCETGDVVEKRSRRGRVFYGCNRFPDCKFASWDELVPKACDTCDSTYLLRKVSRGGDEMFTCPSCGARIKPEAEGDSAEISR